MAVIFTITISGVIVRVNSVSQPGATVFMPPFTMGEFTSGNLATGGGFTGGSLIEVDTTGVTGLPSPFFATIASTSNWQKITNANQTFHYILNVQSSGPQGTYNFSVQTSDQGPGGAWLGPSAISSFSGNIVVAGSGDSDDITITAGTLSSLITSPADMDVAQPEEYHWGGGDRY